MNPIEALINKIVSSIFASWPQKQPSEEQLQNTRIVAHRGVHENNLATENTFPAFELAAQHNIWGVELDIRFSKDHVPVVIHDPDGGRVFQRPDLVIADLTAHEIRAQLPHIPYFSEIVENFGGRLHLMIEIKEDLTLRPQCLGHLQKILQPLQPQHDYHLLALEPDLLTPCQFAPKSAYMDVIWLTPSYTLRKNEQLGHGAIAGHFLFLTDKVIARLKQQNKRFGVGFLDSQNSLYREIRRGADYIFTNHPLRLKNYLHGRIS